MANGTVIETLLVRITADISQLKAQLDAGARISEQKAAQMGGSFDKLKARISGVTSGLFTLKGAIATVIFSKIAKDIIETASAMQLLEKRMEATTGSAKAAGEALNFLSTMAKEQHVDMLSLADGYNRLLPAVKSGALTMGEMRNILRLTNDNMKAMGLTVADQQLLFYGLSQLLGSGVVTMEDLKQVTERLPGSLNLLEAAMRKNNTQFAASGQSLRDFISTGKVTAEMLKGSLVEALSANEGAAASMGATFDSAVTDMKNAWRDFINALAENTGFLEVLAGIISSIAGGLEVLTGWLSANTTALEDQNTALAKAKGLYDGLDGASKSRTEKLKKEALALLDAAFAAQEKTKADIASLKASVAQDVYYGRTDKMKMQQLDMLVQELGIQEETTKKVRDAIISEGKSLEDDTDKTKKNTAAKNAATKSIDDFIQSLEDELKVSSLSEDQRERTINLLKAEKIAREKGGQVTEEQKRKIEQLTAKIKANDDAQDALNKTTEYFVHAAENMQDAMADAFANGKLSAEDFKEFVLRQFAEIAAAAVMKVAIAPLISQAAGVVGGSDLQSAVAKQLGVSGLGDFSGFGKIVDSFGTKLGFSSGLEMARPSANFVGAMPQAQGSMFGSATLSGVLGAGGMGYGIGSLNLFGGNKTGSSVGGTIGGIAGSFLPIPGGTIIGSAVGSFIGSKFGGKAHPASGFIAKTNEEGMIDMNNLDVRSKHMGDDVGKNVAEQVNVLLATLKEMGVDTKGLNLQGGATDTFGYLRTFGDTITDITKDIHFDPNNQGDITRAFDEYADAIVKLTGETRTLTQIQTDYAEKKKKEAVEAQMQADALDRTTKAFSDAEKASKKLAEDFQGIAKKLRDSLASLLISGLSPLSPQEKFLQAQSRFRDISARAQGGDQQAQEDFVQAAQDYLAEAQAYFANNADFKDVFKEVKTAYEKTADKADSIAQQQLDIGRQQLAMLEKIMLNLQNGGSGITLKDMLKTGEDSSVLTKKGGTGLALGIERGIKSQFLAQKGYTFNNMPDIFRNVITDEPSRDAYRAAVRAAGGIPEFALGGTPPIHSPSIIGDGAGGKPELFIPNAAGRIVPNNRITMMDTSGLEAISSSGFRSLVKVNQQMLGQVAMLNTRMAGLETQIKVLVN